MIKLKVTTKEVANLIGADEQDFPKYATQILNLANQNAQGTRPSVVGKMSDLMADFQGNELKEWKEWYEGKYPEAITKATDRILSMIDNFKAVITDIDRAMVERWVSDLIIVKTFIGLRVQVAIIQKIAGYYSASYRLASAEEESQGIDGWIGNQPVSIKPSTYDVKKKMLPEEITIPLVVYEKVKEGFSVSFDEELIHP